LGKGDPKSGHIAGRLDRQPHLKSRHSRTYALALSGTPLGYLLEMYLLNHAALAAH
jgi:hypothetical protein